MLQYEEVIHMSEKLIFEKIVDKSALSDGLTIPMAYHETLYSHLGRRLKHGESMPIQIHMNGIRYDAVLKNLAFDTQKFVNVNENLSQVLTNI